MFARRGLETRGKQRTSIEIESEPLLFDLDELALGAKPSEAVRANLERAVKSIGEFASKATRERRARAERALQGGEKTRDAAGYRRQYSGGRTGLKMPNQTPRLFNDSSRLAEGFFVRENKEDLGWTVNVTANRLTPESFRPGRFEVMLGRLREHVAVLKDVRALLADGEFNRAVTSAVADIMTKGEATKGGVYAARLKALSDARKRAARAALGLLRTAAGF